MELNKAPRQKFSAAEVLVLDGAKGIQRNNADEPVNNACTNQLGASGTSPTHATIEVAPIWPELLVINNVEEMQFGVGCRAENKY